MGHLLERESLRCSRLLGNRCQILLREGHLRPPLLLGRRLPGKGRALLLCLLLNLLSLLPL